jgi:hypothetical protein
VPLNWLQGLKELQELKELHAKLQRESDEKNKLQQEIETTKVCRNTFKFNRAVLHELVSTTPASTQSMRALEVAVAVKDEKLANVKAHHQVALVFTRPTDIVGVTPA